MITWSQSNGVLKGEDGSTWGVGFSGHGNGVNNPAYQKVANVGPIPRGLWSIGKPENSPHTGPFSLPLTPKAGIETFGRSDFLIHGDAITEPGAKAASHGCIILARSVRERIDRYCADRTLSVEL